VVGVITLCRTDLPDLVGERSDCLFWCAVDTSYVPFFFGSVLPIRHRAPHSSWGFFFFFFLVFSVSDRHPFFFFFSLPIYVLFFFFLREIGCFVATCDFLSCLGPDLSSNQRPLRSLLPPRRPGTTIPCVVLGCFLRPTRSCLSCLSRGLSAPIYAGIQLSFVFRDGWSVCTVCCFALFVLGPLL